MKSELILEPLSNRLKAVRNSLKMTQAELAERLNISRNYVHLIESGAKPGGKNIREKLALLEKENPEDNRQPSRPTLNVIPMKCVKTEVLEEILPDCIAAKDWQVASDIALELERRKAGNKTEGEQ